MADERGLAQTEVLDELRDAWQDQMVFLATRAHRCIAYDGHGHGRSSQPYDGNEMNTSADDRIHEEDALTT